MITFLHGKEDFADVIKVSKLLILSSLKKEIIMGA